MTTSDPEEATVVGCAVEGPSHEGTDLPCQDAWCSHRLPGGRFVIAVGDGLGSASFSHDGSEIATERAAQVLKDRFETVDSVDQATTRPIFKRAFTEARTALARKAESSGDDLSDYATTLLAVVAGPTGTAGAAAGDGGAVAGLQDAYEPLVPPEEAVADLGASHRTFPLTHDAWEDYYRFDYREDVDTIAVFSDGLSQWAWKGEHEANTAWFESAFGLIEAADDPECAEQSLREALNNDNYRQSRDDKTLVMGTLGPDETESKIEAEGGDDTALSVWVRNIIGSVCAVTRLFAPTQRNRR